MCGEHSCRNVPLFPPLHIWCVSDNTQRHLIGFFCTMPIPMRECMSLSFVMFTYFRVKVTPKRQKWLGFRTETLTRANGCFTALPVVWIQLRLLISLPRRTHPAWVSSNIHSSLSSQPPFHAVIKTQQLLLLGAVKGFLWGRRDRER